MADINYPTALKTDYEKLAAVYSLIEQMRLEHNRQGAKARSNREKYGDKIATYAGISKNLLKPLLAERNNLKSRILKVTYTDEQRRKLTLEEMAVAQNQMFGDREVLKALPTEATSQYLDELKAIDLDKLGDTPPADPAEVFTSSDWNNGTPQSDPNNRLTVTSSKVEFDTLTRNEDCYFYRDMGVDHFDGDFTHRIETLLDAYSSLQASFVWGLTNNIDDYYGLRMNGYPSLGCLWYSAAEFWVYEIYGVDDINWDVSSINSDTLYYIEIERDENAGTYGTLYAYICDDDYYSNGGNLVDTISISLQVAKRDFRYLFAINSYNTGHSTRWGTGYMQNLDIQEVSATEKTSSDSGAAADAKAAGSPAVMAADTETGQGTDTKVDYPGAAIDSADSGSGTDTALVAERVIYVSDSGSGVESSSLETEGIVNRYGEEAGSGNEVVSQIEIIASESGFGIDTSETAITWIVSETGSGIDIAEAIVIWTRADSGSGLEASVVSPVFFAGDGGLGVESGLLTKDTYNSDTGSGKDILKALIGGAGASPDMRLPGRKGKTRMPSKGVNI